MSQRQDLEAEAIHLDKLLADAEIIRSDTEKVLTLIRERVAESRASLGQLETLVRQETDRLDKVQTANKNLIADIRFGRDQVRKALIELEALDGLAAKIESQLCSSCGHRPRRFDDLCKRCADKAGLRPRGKIGSA